MTFEELAAQGKKSETPTKPVGSGSAFSALAGVGKKGVSRVSSALDAQRFTAAKAAGLGNTTDEQMTNLRKKLGVEQDYQDPRLFGVIPQPPALHHAEQGVFDAALGTVTDPLTAETLGLGAIPRLGAKLMAPLARAGTAIAQKSPTTGKLAAGVHDYFTFGGAAKRAVGKPVVNEALGAESEAMTAGRTRRALYNKMVDTALKGTTDEEKMRVFRWMDGQLPISALSPKEKAAAFGMDRWRRRMEQVGGITSGGIMGHRENYFPGLRDAVEGREAHTYNPLDAFSHHALQREGQFVLGPNATAKNSMEALRGYNASLESAGTGMKFDALLRKTLKIPEGQPIPAEIHDLFNRQIRATGNKRSAGEIARDIARGVVTAPKAAIVGTGPGHMANILNLTLGNPGGAKAAMQGAGTFAKLIAKPGERANILRPGAKLGALNPSAEKHTALIDLLASAPGPLSLPGRAMQGMNRATWSFDDAMAQALAQQFQKQGFKGYQAGRKAREGLVDYEHVSPFTEHLKNVLPFASFTGALPKAVAQGILADPMRAAFANRATGGGFYGSDFDTPLGRFRGYGPTQEIGRAEPKDYIRKQAVPYTIGESALGSYLAKASGAEPKPGSRDYAARERDIRKLANFPTYGQNPLNPKDAKSLALGAALMGIPYGRQAQGAAGMGPFPKQSLQDMLIQSWLRQLHLAPRQ